MPKTRIIRTAALGVVLAIVSTLGEMATQGEASPADISFHETSAGNRDLLAVATAGRSGVIAVGAGGAIAVSADAGKTWRSEFACLVSKPCGPRSRDRVRADLTGVAFWGVAMGVAVGRRGVILSTADGGRTWSQRVVCKQVKGCTAGSPDGVKEDLSAVAVVGPSSAFAVGKGGTIVSSADGGRTWLPQHSCLDTYPCGEDSPGQVTEDLSSVAFFDNLSGYAVGRRGMILSTKNGGRVWAPRTECPSAAACQTSRLSGDLSSVAVGGRNQAWAVGAGGEILATADGAVSWRREAACVTSLPCTPQSPDKISSDLTSIAVGQAAKRYAIGTSGVFLAGFGTGSQVWRRRVSGASRELFALASAGPDSGYAVGKGGLVLRFQEGSGPISVSSVVPGRGPTTGGFSVVVRGRGFARASSVSFGKRAASDFKVANDNELLAISPAQEAGSVGVTVNSDDASSGGLASAEFSYAAPRGGSWVPADSCNSACRAAPSVLLKNGKVLVAGGAGSDSLFVLLNGQAAGEAELYDPVADKWTATGPMAQPRRGHTLTVLRSGEVLAVGGNSADDKRLLGAELYDPSRGRWKPAGSLSSSRLFHTATLLADGRVAVLGGSESSYGEIYDPRTGAWTKTSPGGQVRTFHAAALLPGGQILVTGGQQGADNAALTAEIYDPALDRFSLAGAPLPRALPAATQLKDGNILLSGGQVFGAASRTAEIYDFRRKRFQRVAEMAVPRVAHTSTLLSNGNVVVTGGSVTSLDGPMVPFVEMFEPAKGKWRMLASMSSPRAGHGATLLLT